MKKSKIFLSDIEANNFCNTLRENTSFKNVTTYYEIAVFYSLQNLSKDLLCYIERFFTVVAETENFLQLNFLLLSKILSSSSLDITSELEISNAVDNWLKFNFEERKVFASKLLLKVRLCLISNNSLKCILHESSVIRRDKKCVKLLENALEGKKNLVQDRLSNLNRYCDQAKFNILVCGGITGYSFIKNIHEVDGRNFKVSNNNRFQLTEGRAFLKTVYLKGEIFVLYGGGKFGDFKSVDKYSMYYKTWSRVSDEGLSQKFFCACGLIDKIYVLGGEFTRLKTNTDRCFDTKNYTWKQISKMRYKKYSAACSVYQGKVVVSGGSNNNDGHLSIVEAYDDTLDKWVEMPSMINARHDHSQLTVKNKLFVIGRIKESCEVFDSFNKKFVLINNPIRSLFRVLKSFEAVSIGNKIAVYDFNVQRFSLYNIEKDEWSEEDIEFTKNLANFSCVKVPQLDV